jgi:excinuclease UvrABC nuclease subunit
MENNNKIQGLYFLFDKMEELIYVGLSKDINKRMYSHFGDSMFRSVSSNVPVGSAVRFEYVEVSDYDYLRYLEQECIILFNTKYNFSIKRRYLETNKKDASDVAKELEKIRF